MFQLLVKPSGVTRETKLRLVKNFIFEWEKMLTVQMAISAKQYVNAVLCSKSIECAFNDVGEPVSILFNLLT